MRFYKNKTYPLNQSASVACGKHNPASERPPATMYDRAATVLSYAPEIPATRLAIAVGCSQKMAATLRSLFNTCDGNPIEMRKKANKASRRSKEKAKLAA
jgi:hypothetical protein